MCAIFSGISILCGCLQSGAAHAEMGAYEAAEAAYSRAHEQCMRLMKDLKSADISESQLCELSTSSIDLLLDRLVNAWKLQQMVPTDRLSNSGICRLGASRCS